MVQAESLEGEEIMPISFSCPQCGKNLKAPDNAAGKSSKCPGCGSPVTCPEPVYDAELVDAPLGGMDPYADLGTDEGYGVVGPAADAPGAPEGPAGEARRPCPMCGEMIVVGAAKCRYCGEIFDPALKKSKTKGRKGRGGDDENLTTSEIVVAILCSGIGCIMGLVWMIQGKPKGGKMLGISIIAGIVGGVIRAALMSLNDRGGP
jgi:predicted RNA-binding Zn-ribbon protein involved in translation (DUF1610 family)